jgi:hypothetical protein
MAQSPKHIAVLTEAGVSRVQIRYVRRFVRTVPVQFCWLYKARIEHDCDDFGCWPDQP